MKVCTLLFVAAIVVQSVSAGTPGPKVFPTAEAAARALIDATGGQDTGALSAILGPEADALVNSGDPVQDAGRRARLVGRSKEGLHIEPDPHRPGGLIIAIGKDNWPVPFPLSKVAGGFRFDPAEAKMEILARRIGHNELRTTAALRELAEAERDFAHRDASASGLHEYAGQILSDPGRRNGLFWEAPAGEARSPLADFVDRGAAEGYGAPASGQPPVYHGYAFRVLTGQGPSAHGGARDYLVHGRWLAGFAFVAYPVEYRVSGVKTFLVGRKGVVWEKDLGSDTGTLGPQIRLYDPDSTWVRVLPEAEGAANP